MGKKKTGKDKAAAKAQRVEAKKAKQSAKGAKKDRKALGTEEEDIEQILLEFKKKDAQRTQVTVEPSPQPSPRANFTLSALPSGEMLLFGGEYFDGDLNECFNDVFKWNLDTKQLLPEEVEELVKQAPSEAEALRDAAWKQISSPNTPPPRCSHQAAVYRDHLYVFGGEFATADQFHHYRDLWRLDLKTNAWEELEVKGGPSPRSGHRMVVWRNYLVVFGGFYEAARETKWFNDLYLFNLAELKWQKVTYPPHRQVPAERSGCQLAVHPSKDLVFVYGGYAKVKNAGEKSEGKVYSDLWALNLAPVLKKQPPTWEKLSRKGQAPSPRGGAAVTVHKQRFILFGGVFDEEKRRHTMQSTFYNDLFVYDMDRRRWFEFKLRGKKSNDGKRRRKKKAKALEDGDADSDDGEEEEEEEEVEDFDTMLEKQFGYVDDEGNIVYIEDAHEEEETKEGDEGDEEPVPAPQPRELVLEEEKEEEKEEEVVVEESKEEEAEEEPAPPAPSPRINPAVMIRGSTLYVYGGVVEDGDREITLDDCWSLDLKRLDEWKEVLPGTMAQQVWKGEMSETEESSDGDDDDDDEDEDYDDDDEDDDVGAMKAREEKAKAKAMERAMTMLATKAEGEENAEKEVKKEKKKKSKKESHRRAIRAEMEKLQEQLGLADMERTPQMGENLRDFFARTDATWAREVMNLPSTKERELSIKEIKREGFALAEARYQELLPVLERLNALELEQKEAEERHQLKKKSSKEKSRR